MTISDRVKDGAVNADVAEAKVSDVDSVVVRAD
jgi:hypothetical protein